MSRIALSIFALFFISTMMIRAGDENPNPDRGRMEDEKLRDKLREYERATMQKIHEQGQEMKERVKGRMAEIDEQIAAIKKSGKDDGNQIASLEKARDMLLRRLNAPDPMPAPVVANIDDAQQRAIVEKRPAQGNSRLRVKLATGAELEAEGAWLQTIPDVTRDILDQFTDAAKDGVVSFRVPDYIDGEGILQLRTTLLKVAPKVNVEYADRIRLMTATSDDPVQLRRVASVFRTVQKNPGNDFKQGFFDPNAKKNPKGDPRFFNEQGRMKEEMIKLPDGTMQFRITGEDIENLRPMKEPRPEKFEKKDANNDQF